jgi:hypothetical protein
MNETNTAAGVPYRTLYILGVVWSIAKLYELLYVVMFREELLRSASGFALSALATVAFQCLMILVCLGESTQNREMRGLYLLMIVSLALGVPIEGLHFGVPYALITTCLTASLLISVVVTIRVSLAWDKGSTAYRMTLSKRLLTFAALLLLPIATVYAKHFFAA